MSAPNSKKKCEAKSRPHSSPDPSCGRETIAEAGRIQNPRKLFRPAESFFRILNQDFAGKKFGFCSGDTAEIQNRRFRQNAERRKATRRWFPPEFAKGF